MQFINLTPLDITIGHMENELFYADQVFPKSEKAARVTEETTPATPIDGIAVNNVKLLEVENLPEPQEGVRYIVSMPVQQFATGRNDLVSPYSEKAARKGNDILGVPAFVRYTALTKQHDAKEKTEAQFSKFVNMTFQDVTIRTGNEERKIQKSGTVVKIRTEETDVEELGDFKCYTIQFCEIENLPAPQEGVIYIVPMPVAQAAADRNDVYAADTGASAIRDNGRLVAFTALARYV
ncbi:MAG: hypothetical protein JSR46_03680 [Verrucomicrobia bacterium]|nr:hypothetical protein [Verrucomicrobiota bacterium]